jgi:hypothetical protein
MINILGLDLSEELARVLACVMNLWEQQNWIPASPAIA